MSIPTSIADDEYAAALSAAQQRIVQHHGYIEKQLIDGLAITIYAVLTPNRNDLLALLDRAATDVNLAVELFQNTRRPLVRRSFEGAVLRELHNYVASAVTVVDHARRVLRGRTGATVDEFARRKTEMNASGLVPFVHCLRSFVLHRQLPFLGHEVRLQPQPGVLATSDLRLSVEELMGWDGWTAPAKAFLATQQEAIPLRPVIVDHAELLMGLNLWLYEQLAAANESALDEVNELVTERNAILARTTIDEAHRVTAVWTAMRESPTPDPNITIEDLMPRQTAP